ncbi:MAG: TetR/AcrR family transcriptional regulator [Bilophila sp.]
MGVTTVETERHVDTGSPAGTEDEKTRRTPLSVTRAKALRVAEELFRRNGVQAASVDAIATAAGIKKMTLYRCFPVKENLVLACLQVWEAAFQAEWEQSMARFPEEPARQLHAFFEDQAQALSSPDAYGVVFQRLAAAYPNPEHPVRCGIREHNALLRAKIRVLAQKAEASDPETLTDTLCLLLAGLYTVSQTLGADSAPVRNTPNIVEKCLRQGCGAGAFPPVHRVFRRW